MFFLTFNAFAVCIVDLISAHCCLKYICTYDLALPMSLSFLQRRTKTNKLRSRNVVFLTSRVPNSRRRPSSRVRSRSKDPPTTCNGVSRLTSVMAVAVARDHASDVNRHFGFYLGFFTSKFMYETTLACRRKRVHSKGWDHSR